MPFSLPSFEVLSYTEVDQLLQGSKIIISSVKLPAKYAGIYQLRNQYIIQFYNGTGISLPPDVPLESISQVDFHPAYYPFNVTGLTYSVKIPEATFEELGGFKEEMKDLGHHGLVEFLRGKGELTLAYWNPVPMTEWYFVIESPGTMASMDLEMASNVPLGKIEESRLIPTGKPETMITDDDFYLLHLFNGRCANIEGAIKQLSEMLLIERDRLDFSEASLSVLDQALFWNMNRVNAYALSGPLTAYVGECILKVKGEGWYWSEHLSIVNAHQHEIQIGGDIHKSTIDSDHGWSVKHVYDNAMR